jgi:predicted permease
MMNILIAKLAGLAALIGLGYIFGRRNILNGEPLSRLAWLVIDVTMPALFFSGVSRNGFIVENKGLIVAILGGLGVSALAMLLSWPLMRVLPLNYKEKGTFWFNCCIGNSSFLPLPLCYALWGNDGTLACLGYIMGNNLFLFTAGIGMLRGLSKRKKNDILRVFLHPQALAFVLGLSCFYLKILIPQWFFESVQGLGQATIPLSMLVTGAILAGEGVRWKGKGAVYASLAGFKLLLLPAAVFICLKPLKNGPFGGVGASVVLLEAAMPCLASAGAYASRFGGDSGLAAACSLITTLASPLTIPLWMTLWG